MELQVAVEFSAKEIPMTKKSNLNRLAYKLRLWLPVVVRLVFIATVIADIVSKAVNYYARQFRELQLLISTQRQARFFPI